MRQIEIPARRGDFFDRRGVPLAQSVEVDSIWIDPSLLKEPPKAARDLARALKLDADDLLARFSRGKRFAWVKRQVKPAEVDAVKKLELGQAVGFTKEPKRFYPQRELAAHVIGLAGTEGNGLEGLELAFDDELTGQGSKLQGFRDAKGRKLLTSGGVDGVRAAGRVGDAHDRPADPVPRREGAREGGRRVEGARGDGGGARPAHRRDPRARELPALQPERPRDLGAPGASATARRSTLFEPGSTFKAFVVAAALEEKAIKPDDIFFCENGSWRIGRHTINDTHPHGWLTAGDDPPGAARTSARGRSRRSSGARSWSSTTARFGFGEQAGLGAPGRGAGLAPVPEGGGRARHPVVRPGADRHRGAGRRGLRGARQRRRADAAVPGLEGGRPGRGGAAREQADRGAPGGLARRPRSR